MQQEVEEQSEFDLTEKQGPYTMQQEVEPHHKSELTESCLQTTDELQVSNTDQTGSLKFSCEPGHISVTHSSGSDHLKLTHKVKDKGKFSMTHSHNFLRLEATGGPHANAGILYNPQGLPQTSSQMWLNLRVLDNNNNNFCYVDTQNYKVRYKNDDVIPGDVSLQWIIEPSTSCQGPITIVNRVFSKKTVYLDTNGSKELQYYEIKGVKDPNVKAFGISRQKTASMYMYFAICITVGSETSYFEPSGGTIKATATIPRYVFYLAACDNKLKGTS